MLPFNPIFLLIVVAAVIAISLVFRRGSAAAQGDPMLSKKFALGFGIAVALPLVVYYGVSTFSPPPKWEDYFPAGSLARREKTPEEEVRLQQEESRRQQLYKEHKHHFVRSLFFVAAPIGIAAIIAGSLIAVEAIGTGLMFGGIFTVIEGYVWYWGALEHWMRFLSLLAAFLILIFIGYRKFGPSR